MPKLEFSTPVRIRVYIFNLSDKEPHEILEVYRLKVQTTLLNPSDPSPDLRTKETQDGE